MAKTFPAAEIVSVFGQTEMSPVTTVLPSADAVRKIGSVGKPIPTIAARVVDERLNDVPRGLVPLRRPGPGGRGGLPVRRRPEEGHDHLRRREHLLR
jgi:fatty-acyl-CoA synthase